MIRNVGVGASDDERERVLRCVPEFSGEDWNITLSDTETAAAATTDTAPGPDGLPCALCRGAEWIASYFWAMLRGIVDGNDNAGEQEFGLAFSAMLPKMVPEAAPERVTVCVGRTRPI